MKEKIIIILIIFLIDSCKAQIRTFQNPVLDDVVSFPSVYKHRDFYYMSIIKDGKAIELLKSPILSDFRQAERRQIYTTPGNTSSLQSAKLHNIRGNFYIYFDIYSSDCRCLRVHVIKSLDPCNLLGSWSNETMLLPDDDDQSNRGTVLQSTNGELHFIWDGLVLGGYEHKLYIAKLETPMKVVGPKTLLRAPTMDWESHGGGVNEGASILQRNGATFLVFSASYSGSPEYCLGIMGIDGGKDPMMVSNWWNDVPHCIFAKNEVEGVWGTGHASFVTSPDDSEVWMMYIARDDNFKTARIQKMEWAEMNRPKFPTAAGLNRELEVPSGE